ncbi:cell division cycle protein 20 homolog [Genypterus blacodes]|uniref:cell division cycle protein 20 homolog n=1 Tax=Genypterus blacodes TaxID=154954 RepID=UPI003F7719C8
MERTEQKYLTESCMANRRKLARAISGKKEKLTHNKVGGDRFIPIRNDKQMEVASFLLSKNEPRGKYNAASSSDKGKALPIALNGYDIQDANILSFEVKPPNAPEGYQNNLKVLQSQAPTRIANQRRQVSSYPYRVLDAPHLRNDFYLNPLDWSSRNHLAVALDDSVYIFDVTEGNVTLLMKCENDYICSVNWTKDGNHLAIGTSDGKVQLWDVESQKCLRKMSSHRARVVCLGWNQHLLSSGSMSGHIHHHDVKVKHHHIATLSAHSQEVCSLKWSADGRYLASGGNDNMVYVWPRVQEGGISSDSQPVHRWDAHQGAVKALAWCPWQPNILASGGGSNDGHIRIWNAHSGSCISSLDTQSQISSLVFAPNYKELVSAHGCSHNNMVIWKYPSLSKVAVLHGHADRVLSLAQSPDDSTVASIAADETVRLWKSFELNEDRMANTTCSLIHQSIR